MPIDSTADLLFRIGANTDDAESNVARFRTILSKDLGDIGGEFSDWAEKTFGALNTVSGVATAGVAALGAAIVGAAGVALHAANAYEQFVGEIAHGAAITNLNVQTMSGLHMAAQLTGTSFDGLTRGIAFFERQVDAANQGGKQQLEMFGRLGVSTKDLAAGEKDMAPLLELVAKRFHELGSGAERVAIARGLFSRSGVEDQKALDLLASGIEGIVERARRMGLVITEEDVVAMKKYKMAAEEMRAAQEALDLQIGRATLPLLTRFKVAMTALFEAEQGAAKGENIFAWFWDNIRFGLTGTGDLAKGIHDAAEKIRAEMKSLMDAMAHGAGDVPDAGPAVAEKVKENFEGISGVLERLTGELAGFGTEEDQAEEKIHRMVFEMGKALDELKKKQAEGSLAPGVYARELAAWQEFAQKMPQLYDELMSQIRQRRIRAGNDAETELRSKIAKEQEVTRASQEKAFEAEIDAQEQKFRADKSIALENLPALLALAEQWRAAGLAKMREGWAAEDLAASEHDGKVAAEKKAAFDSEIARLQEQVVRIEREHMTAEERIAAQYQADVAKYSAAEEKKSLATETEEAKRAAIRAKFAAMRTALYNKEQADLQELINSRGWRGVFGNEFAQAIRGNEALSKEWATSMSQGAMMVRVAIESLGEMGQKSFEGLAQGMGGNIAHAVVYSASIEKAMRQALGATLESIAAQAMVQAIYATGLGFLDLALGDYEAAGQAFAAAAIFGSVGAAAAVSGRAVVGSQTTGAGGQGSGAGARGGAPAVGQFGSDMAAKSKNAQAGFQAGGTAAGAGGPHVTMNVYGHIWGVSGVQEVASALNDAVMNKGVTLTASNTKTGVQVTR